MIARRPAVMQYKHCESLKDPGKPEEDSYSVSVRAQINGKVWSSVNKCNQCSKIQLTPRKTSKEDKYTHKVRYVHVQNSSSISLRVKSQKSMS